jgi:uncharacterized OB-fold protein
VKRIRPLSNPEYQEFYGYVDQRDLHLQRCADCGVVRFPVSPVCHACFSDRWAWQRSSGRGRVSSWVVFRRQYFEDYPPPYTVVQVEMDEGPRLTANLLGTEPEVVTEGMPVHVTYEELAGGGYLLQFERDA